MSVKTKVSARRHSAATHLELHRQGRRTAISPARSPVPSVAVQSGKASGRLAMNAHGGGVKDRFVATTGCSDASPGPTMQWTRVCAAPVVATVKQQRPDADVQPGGGGGDGLAGAAGGGQGEGCRRERDGADVRVSRAATGLRRGADAAGERAPAAVGNRAAVLPLRGAGRGCADDAAPN